MQGAHQPGSPNPLSPSDGKKNPPNIYRGCTKCMHACMHAYIHTYITLHYITYIHTYIHTYICAYIYIYICICAYDSICGQVKLGFASEIHVFFGVKFHPFGSHCAACILYIIDKWINKWINYIINTYNNTHTHIYIYIYLWCARSMVKSIVYFLIHII